MDSTKTGDIMNNILLSSWANQVKTIIKNRRLDKYAMHAVPFPINYQEFGAEGKNLTPKDLLEFQTNALLDGMGYPQELFKGTLQYVQMPTGMRIFENSFIFIYIGFNNLSQWVVRKVRSYLNQPPMQVMVQKPSLADSLERKQLVFQLAAMGEVSRETAWESLGIEDAVAEMKKRLEEDAQKQRDQMKMQQELQKEMETGVLQSPEQGQGQGQGGSTPGGAPTQGGITPGDIQDQSQQLATYWLSLPVGERSKAMQSVKAQDQTTYAMAKEVMEQMRRQGASQGTQQVSQDAQQQVQNGGN